MKCSLCNEEKAKIIGTKEGSRFVRCMSCELVRIDPHPTDSELADFYSNYVYEERVTKPHKKWFRFRMKVLPLMLMAPGKKFLDIGCNVGSAVAAAAWLGCDAVGIDVGPNAIKQAEGLWPHCRFYNETIEIFSERGEKFDIVFCTEVIEHVRDLHSFMNALQSVLNPGAVLFFTTPDSGHFRVPKNNLLNWKEFRPVQHLAIFNKKNIKRMFNQHGLTPFFFYPMHRANMRFYARYQP